MLALPAEVACGGMLPYLCVFDLQALDTAFTNKYLRPQLQQVWKSYQYDSLDVELRESEVSWLCEVGVQIVSVVINEFGAPSSEFCETNIPTLKKLHMVSKAKESVLLQRVSNCLGLEELCLKRYITDKTVSALAQNCTQLHTLHIGSKVLTDTGIRALAQHCRKLYTLRISVAQATDAGIQALCDNCPHLTHIVLLYCYNLTDASLIAIAHSFPGLQSVLLCSNHFTDYGIADLADKCRQLRSVSVKCCSITSRSLTALWGANPNLMDVDISFNEFISDNDIISLTQCCSLLQKLNISYYSDITDAAVIAVAEHCPQLRSLDIHSCGEISDASLIALGQHCHELKSIVISHVYMISDVGIAALAAGCPLLQEFYADSTKITDAGVAALARGCRNLRKMYLNGCRLICLAAVSVISQYCSLISVLDLSHCRLDDACLHVIARRCRNLTSLSIMGLNVSVASVVDILSSCRMLRTMYCLGCFKTEEEKLRLRRCSRKLALLRL